MIGRSRRRFAEAPSSLNTNGPDGCCATCVNIATSPSPSSFSTTATGISRMDDAPKGERFPASYLVIEGHNRFEIAAAMVQNDTFASSVRVWLMEPHREE
jgi:hypothetical protein